MGAPRAERWWLPASGPRYREGRASQLAGSVPRPPGPSTWLWAPCQLIAPKGVGRGIWREMGLTQEPVSPEPVCSARRGSPDLRWQRVSGRGRRWLSRLQVGNRIKRGLLGSASRPSEVAVVVTRLSRRQRSKVFVLASWAWAPSRV